MRPLRAQAPSPLGRWLEPLRLAWQAKRDKLLTDGDFRRFATRFPLTRPIARARTRALFDLCAGFVYSQVLSACVRLGVFERLRSGPRRLDDLAQDISLSRDACRRLLDAAAALRLLERRGDDLYGLGALGSALIDNPGLVAMIDHHERLYRDLADPVALLRGEADATELSKLWPYAHEGSPAELDESRVAGYTALMAASQPMVAEAVLDAYPMIGHRRLLDVGGGDGTFLSAALRRVPALSGMLFDLPAVAEKARASFAEQGLATRVQVFGGSFLSDPIPAGADVATLVRVLHDHDDAAVLGLLAAVRRALPDRGVLLIAEPMSGTRGGEAIADAYFGFYLLSMGSGRPRSPERIASMLQQVGFAQIRLQRSGAPLLVQVVSARAANGAI